MEFTRFGRGVLVLAIALGIFSLFFDDLPSALAAGGLVFLLLARAAVFLSALSASAGSISVSRTVSSRFVRQGMAIEVVTRVSHTPSPSFTMEMTDLLPGGSAISGGSPSVTREGGCDPSCLIRYSIVPMSIGEQEFPGVTLRLSDLLFTTSLTDRTTSGPVLVVLPASAYELSGSDRFGDEETSGASPIVTPGIRSFREYVPGDDLRTIDWKLSAKHDTLYVREYMGGAETAHLLVIDLPDASLPFSPAAFARLREAAVSSIARELSDTRGISVLLVSGANVISFSPAQSDPKKVITMMQKLVPFPRLHYLYRYVSNESLRRRSLRIRSGMTLADHEDVPAGAFLPTRVSDSFLPDRSPTAYEVQVTRVLRALSTSTAHLFSLAAGDVSHLCLFAEQAALRGMAVHLHIPREAQDPWTREKIRACRFASVEAV